MKARDSFSLSWCEKHENWYQYNCPDCMVDTNEQDIKMAGIKGVVEWVNKNKFGLRAMDNYCDFGIDDRDWQAFLKGLGVEEADA